MTDTNITAIIAGATSILAVVISTGQYRITRQQWKMQLHAQRYPIYLETMQFITDAVTTQIDETRFAQLTRETRDSELLFGNEVKMHIERVRDAASNLMDLHAKRKWDGSDVEKAKYGKAYLAAFEDFRLEHERTKKVFKKYLKFS